MVLEKNLVERGNGVTAPETGAISLRKSKGRFS